MPCSGGGHAAYGNLQPIGFQGKRAGMVSNSLANLVLELTKPQILMVAAEPT